MEIDGFIQSCCCIALTKLLLHWFLFQLFMFFSSSFTSHVLTYSYLSAAGTDDRGRSYATSKGGCKVCKCDECDVFM